MGEQHSSNSQRWSSRDQSNESSASKERPPYFNLCKAIALLVVSFTIGSCGASKKVIVERENPTFKKVEVPVETPKKLEQSANLPSMVLTNKEKIRAYVNQFAPIAQKEMTSFGIPASITLAQGILESGMGYGRLAVEGNNHFGIKCHTEWEGERIYHDDDKKGECFRVYSDPEQSYRDHSLFLKDRSRYSFLFEIKPTNYKAWAQGLKKAGYATDPNYPAKLISLIERFDLTRFDEGKRAAKKTKAQFVHTVKKGDTLYSVSKKYNVPIERIIELNEIQDQTIYLGQSLTIPSNP